MFNMLLSLFSRNLKSKETDIVRAGLGGGGGGGGGSGGPSVSWGGCNSGGTKSAWGGTHSLS